MNVIDQAFVKAYSRRSQPRSVRPTSDHAVAPGTGTSDVSVHPQAANSAVIWIDAVGDQYLRSDAAHPGAPTAPLAADAPREPLSPRGSSGNPIPLSTPAPVAVPSAVTVASSAASPSPMRVDLSSLYHSVIASPSPQPHAPKTTPGDGQHFASSRQADPLPASGPAAAAATVSFQPFTAAWEVDAFEYSSTVTALFGSPELMKSIGDPLDRAVSEGLQTLLITSDRIGAGQTTVATGIALSAAAAGLRVALVDATVAAKGSSSSLADALNLDVQQGWVDAIRSGTSVAETAVHSIEDQLTVIPKTSLCGTAAPTAEEFSRMIVALRRGFDLIVVDGPCCRESALGEFTTAARCATARALSGGRPADSRPVDAVILVQDVRHNGSMAAHILDSLKRQGITGLGLVENFT